MKSYIEFLHLVGALMEYFLKGSAPFRHCYMQSEMGNKYNSSLLSKLMKALIELFLQGNVPLR